MMDFCKGFVIALFLHLATASPLPRRHRSPIEDLECEVQSTDKVVDGFAPYTETRITCSDVTPSTYYNVTCDERCRDPVKQKPLSKKYYASKPIARYQTFVTREGETFQERITISCRCVATRKGLKKARKAKSSREKHNRRKHHHSRRAD